MPVDIQAASLVELCLLEIARNPRIIIRELCITDDLKDRLAAMYESLVTIDRRAVTDSMLEHGMLQNDTDLFRLAIITGASVKASFLIDMIKKDNYETVKFVIEKYPDVQKKMMYSTNYKKEVIPITPLCAAVKYNNYRITKLLLQKGGANVNYATHTRAFPFCLTSACFKKNRGIVQLLLKHGARVSAKHVEYLEQNLPDCERKSDIIAILKARIKGG